MNMIRVDFDFKLKGKAGSDRHNIPQPTGFARFRTVSVPYCHAIRTRIRSVTSTTGDRPQRLRTWASISLYQRV